TAMLTVDKSAPTVVSFTPDSNAIGVLTDANIVLTFNEAVKRGSGLLQIKDALGTVIESFDIATSSRLSLSGTQLTIDPTANLAHNTRYQVVCAAGTLLDLAGNAYAGLDSHRFTTQAVDVTGTEGNDSLVGTNLSESLYGLDGDDVITALDGFDRLYGGTGNDLMRGGSGDDRLSGGLGADELWGESGNDTLSGSSGQDRLSGGSGADTLDGGSGADLLIGGSGRDLLTGGAEADQFKFLTPTELGDTITDFSAAEADRLLLVSAAFGNLATGPLASFRFRASSTGAANSGNQRFLFNTGTGVLKYDADGNGSLAAVTVATLNVRSLSASHILMAAG
ncbi:MAG: Ig-like domain-containing protein, partial [Magnetococcales bacterium]|nr:Ig-like domain-containing protein [Magnetococcales bacterium]